MKNRLANLSDVEKLLSFKLENLFGSDVRGPANIWLAGLYKKILRTRLLKQFGNGTQFFLVYKAQTVLAYISFIIQNQQAVISDICASQLDGNASCLGKLIHDGVKKISQYQCREILARLPREYKEQISIFLNNGFIRSGRNHDGEVELLLAR